ncbi:peptidoglycan DD-metalloendopeptidase family protein [Candidatus Oleimmundimicrobium sp.]|uniref:peptidoglycan DD-metalloendopeptidase family protein n=1 Tax=Candidatus Oleimmundimicrobium sp. TaxID=3060597 RepID=UPI00271CFDF7|nr:peptidoglycan DD-metalloendopeptidase family protein [Candidatus Oleimmundimicrobium sp.]MDO8885332.1 peptidoglycan DD-metalloendopeptidase family protein [Candidatus Oleimmundimicrobium sp.]
MIIIICESLEEIRIRQSKVFFVTVISLLFILLIPSVGACVTLSKQKQAEKFKEEVNGLQTQLNRITREYNSAYNEYIETINGEEETMVKLELIEKELKTKEALLDLRLKAIYTQENLSFLKVLLNSTDFNDFLTCFYLCERVGAWEARVIREARELKIELKKQKAELEEKRTQQKALLKKLDKKKEELDEKFKKSKSLFSVIEKELKSAPRVTPRTIKGVKISCFPVSRPYAYSDTWLAPRRGHLHQGCDVFAAKGTPCYVCVSGRVKMSSSRNGGKTIYLSGDSGDLFYYMHLDKCAVAGGHVEAGQVIGYIGDSGNARGGVCHLHFEVHPGGGRAVNPYLILRSIE